MLSSSEREKRLRFSKIKGKGKGKKKEKHQRYVIGLVHGNKVAKWSAILVRNLARN